LRSAAAQAAWLSGAEAWADASAYAQPACRASRAGSSHSCSSGRGPASAWLLRKPPALCEPSVVRRTGDAAAGAAAACAAAPPAQPCSGGPARGGDAASGRAAPAGGAEPPVGHADPAADPDFAAEPRAPRAASGDSERARTERAAPLSVSVSGAARAPGSALGSLPASAAGGGRGVKSCEAAAARAPPRARDGASALTEHVGRAQRGQAMPNRLRA